MKKVLFFGHQTEVGGGEISLLQLIGNLESDQYTPVLVIPGEGKFNDLASKYNVRKINFPLDRHFVHANFNQLRSKGFLFALKYVMKLIQYGHKFRRILAQEKPDILHTNTLTAALIGILAATGKRIPHIYHDRTFTTSIANKMIHRFADQIIVISDSVKQKYEQSRKVQKVYNGVDLSLFEFIPKTVLQEEIVIAVIGRVIPWKGQDVFIKAAAMLKVKMMGQSRMKFKIIGSSDIESDSSYLDRLNQLVKANDLTDDLEFMDYHPNIYKVMQGIDIVVVPSTMPEPFGRVVIEGQIAKAAVVASRIGGIPELIIDGDTGLLFEPGNEHDLAEKLYEIIRNREKRQEIQTRGFIHATKNYSIQQHVRSIISVYGKM